MVLTDDHHIYLYRHDGREYSLMRKIPSPDDVTKGCLKAISDTAVFVQQDTDKPTHQYDRTDLHQQGTRDHNGRLRDVLYPSTLVYGQRRASKDWIIALHQPDGKRILQPPSTRTWGRALSVCRTEDYFVVVEKWKSSMDVFSLRGNILLLCCYKS